MQLRKDSKPYKILKCVLLGGGVLALSMVSPLGGAQLVRGLIKEYFRKKRFQRELFLRDLRRLQVRNLVDYHELPDGRIKIILTKSGREQQLVYNLDNLHLDTKKKWDGKWRMVIFDIPDYQKKARDALRKKLRFLGFYPIQESVFITPHECEKEIDFICSIFNVRHYVLIFYIDRFEGEEKFKHHFRI
ncbi:MAG: hypothetical protein AAB646_00310 [Patescibacteria group bacterium]